MSLIRKRRRFTPYSSVGDYSDGLIKVEKNDVTYFISESGREFAVPKGWSVSDFSEGVCRARDENLASGYIYNPLGHGDYVYNQTTVSKDELFSLNRSASAAFESKEYGKAKEICYTLIMADPLNVNYLNNYAAAIYNLGYYEEALSAIQKSLSLEPDNETANNIQTAALRKINQRDREKEEYAEVTTSTSVWEQLGRFAEALAGVSSALGSGRTYNSEGSYTSPSAVSSPSMPSGSSNYQSQYQTWERIAERHYNSITNTGASVTKKDGSKRGSSIGGMSPSKYNHAKRSYREAQREMARIRREAAKAGVNIPQSKWETNSISY